MKSAKLTIAIPVYNQPELLARCLYSVSLQKYDNYQIVIVDDCSTVTYSFLLKDFSFLPIQYRRNCTNLGSMHNMKLLLETEWDTEYLIVFHEDDMMHPDFLHIQVDTLETSPSIAFSGTLMKYFNEENYEYYYSENRFRAGENRIFQSSSDFLASIFLKEEVCFGSIIYRTSQLKKVKFEVEKYGPLCDRPFLLSIIANGAVGCLVKYPLVYYRDHGPNDKRFSKLSEQQILKFFRFYKASAKGSSMLQKQYLSYATNEALWFCHLSDKISLASTYRIFLSWLCKSLVSIKYLNPKGLRALRIYNLILHLKKIKDMAS